jgi:hypothetical protein
MSLDDCKQRMIAKAAGKMSPERAQELIDEIIDLKDREFAEGLNDTDAQKRFLKKVAEKSIEQKNITYMNKVAMLEQKVRAHNDADKFMDVFAASKKIDQGIQSIFAGTQQKLKGTAQSIDGTIKSNQRDLVGRVITQLEKEDLLQFAGDKDVNHQALLVKDHMMRNGGAMPDSPNIRPEAARIGEIFYQQSRYAHNKAKILNVNIADNTDFMATNSHDPSKLAAMGFENWKNLITPELDPKVLQNQNADDYLKQAFENIVSGYHLKDFDITDKKSTGNSSATGSLNKARKLIFKDAESWLRYNDAAGKGSYIENFIQGQSKFGKALGIAQSMGVNPSQYLSDLENLINRKMREKYDPSEIRSDAIKNQISEYSKIISGEAIKSWDLLDKGQDFPRQAEKLIRLVNTFKLGQLALTSLSDLPLTIEASRHFGANQAEGFMSLTKYFFGQFDKEAVNNAMESTHAGMQAFSAKLEQGLQNANADMQDDPTSWTAKAERGFHKWIGATAFQDATEKFAVGFMSKFLGGNKGSAFEDLNPDLQREFGRHNISAKEWDLYRSGISENGQLLPSVVENIPDEAIKTAYGIEGQAATSRKRLELESTLYQMYHVINNDFVLKPNIAQDKYKYKLQSGPYMQAINRQMYALKSYGFALWNRTSRLCCS